MLRSEYQRTATGALIPTSAVALPAGRGGGDIVRRRMPRGRALCHEPEQPMGARGKSTRRRGGYQMGPHRLLGEISTTLGDSNHFVWWLVRIQSAARRRANWYSVTDLNAGFSTISKSAFTRLRRIDSTARTTAMGLRADQIGFWKRPAQLDVGGNVPAFQ